MASNRKNDLRTEFVLVRGLLIFTCFTSNASLPQGAGARNGG